MTNSTDMIEHLVAPYIYYKEWRFKNENRKNGN